MENHMKKRWEIRRVSTPERIFKKIQAEMAQPVGIILFGADCNFKQETIDEIVSQLLNQSQRFGCYFNQAPDMGRLKDAFHNFKSVLVVLDSEASASHSSRHDLVEGMRRAGAKTIVGIYVKMPKYSPKALARIPTAFNTNNQIDAIERSHPTADGLGYFIVIEPDQ